MIKDVPQIIAIVVGLAVMILRRPFARSSINFQNRFWGYSYGEREIKAGEAVALIVGTAFIIFAIANLRR